MAAEILKIRFCQHVCDGERDTSDAERENRAIRDLIYDELCNGDISFGRCLVGTYRKWFVFAFNNVVSLGKMDTVGTVHALKLRVMFVDLKDHGSCALKHGSPCKV